MICLDVSQHRFTQSHHVFLCCKGPVVFLLLTITGYQDGVILCAVYTGNLVAHS